MSALNSRNVLNNDPSLLFVVGNGNRTFWFPNHANTDENDKLKFLNSPNL
jgi:hypothetical protein